MGDVVITVPQARWAEWVAEGDLPGDDWTGLESYYRIGSIAPDIEPGERVYVVAWGRLRGYAPLVRLEQDEGVWHLVRCGGARAVTIVEEIRGFRGWRYRWWRRGEERLFPEWAERGVPVQGAVVRSAQGRLEL